MRKMDSLGLKLCSYQAKLFESSLNETECSSPIFIRRFMNSHLARRMDNPGFLFGATSRQDALDELEEQYGASSYGSEKYTAEELHWIGYIYRYWAYISERSSRQLYKMVKPAQLKKMYYPYHSLDPQQAIERIADVYAPEANVDCSDIARGVAIMRKIRRKMNKEPQV